jgi:hypothetical protein
MPVFDIPIKTATRRKSKNSFGENAKPKSWIKRRIWRARYYRSFNLKMGFLPGGIGRWTLDLTQAPVVVYNKNYHPFEQLFSRAYDKRFYAGFR